MLETLLSACLARAACTRSPLYFILVTDVRVVLCLRFPPAAGSAGRASADSERRREGHILGRAARPGDARHVEGHRRQLP